MFDISKGIKIDDLIGEDINTEEMKQHTENGRLCCICTHCNDAKGYNRRGRQIRERLENLYVEKK